jgi:hypothetical protein
MLPVFFSWLPILLNICFGFRKVRHKNVVQFIGACTKPPTLCIVTGTFKKMFYFELSHFSDCDGDCNNMTTIIYFCVFQNICLVAVYMIIFINIKVSSRFLL